MAQYYTLEEAARVLQTTQDEVKKLAEDKKVRAFRDRGTLRFRAQEIDELARARGLGSDPELQLGEVPAPKKGGSPPPAKKSAAPQDQGEVFNFNLSIDDDSDQVEIGKELAPGPGSSKSGSSKSGSSKSAAGKSGGSSRKMAAPESPVPKPGSDSDVRLVSEGSDVEFEMKDQPGSGASKGSGSGAPKSSGKLAGPDSGVRIVPLADDSDSDVKMVPDQQEGDSVSLGRGKPKSGSDSDIRLEESGRHARGPGSDQGMVTEEIDLDAEMRGQAPKTQKGQPQLPTESPFELSGDDIDRPARKPSRPTQHKPADTDSSDDFEIAPGESSSPLELGTDEVELGAQKKPGASDSGINLRDPADSGISLEQEGSDEIDLELAPGAGKTPRPDKKKEESSSEFELSLEDSGEASGSDSSEFELSLESEASSELELEGPADSDSEFELTLDDSGSLSPADSAEKDIFETDFEVPSLEADSGSEAVALDDETDLESSDFDLALSDEDMVAEEESGSQVVALEDEDEADEGAATVTKPKRRRQAAAAEEDEWGGLEEGDEAPAGRTRVEYVEAAAAPWPVWASIAMFFPVVVLFLVGIMGFEMVRGMAGYRKSDGPTGYLSTKLTETITGETLPGSQKK